MENSFSLQDGNRTIASQDSDMAEIIEIQKRLGVRNNNGQFVDDVEASKKIQEENLNEMLNHQPQLPTQLPKKKAAPEPAPEGTPSPSPTPTPRPTPAPQADGKKGTAEDLLGSKEGVGYNMVAGVADFAQNTINLVGIAAEAAADLAGKDIDVGEVSFADDYFPKADGMGENLIRAGTQFLVPFGGFSKLANANKAIKAASGMANIGKNALIGGAADFVAMKGDDQHIMDLVGTVPALAQYVAYLKKNPNDSEVNKRLKNFVSGMFGGVAGDLAIKGVAGMAKGVYSGVKAWAHKLGIRAATQEAAELGEKLTTVMEKKMPPKVDVPEGAAAEAPNPDAGIKTNADSAPVVEAKSTIVPPERALGLDLEKMTAEDLVDMVKGAGEAVGGQGLKGKQYINLDKFGAPEDVLKVVKAVADKHKDALIKMFGDLDKKGAEAFQYLQDNLGVAVDQLMTTELGRMLPEELYVLAGILKGSAHDVAATTNKFYDLWEAAAKNPALQHEANKLELEMLGKADALSSIYAHFRGESFLASRKLSMHTKINDLLALGDAEMMADAKALFGNNGIAFARRMKTVGPKGAVDYAKKRMMMKPIADASFEVYRNNLLFNVKSQMVNTVSNVTQTYGRSLDLFVAGAHSDFKKIFGKSASDLRPEDFKRLMKERDDLLAMKTEKMGPHQLSLHGRKIKKAEALLQKALNMAGSSGMKESLIYGSAATKKSFQSLWGFIESSFNHLGAAAKENKMVNGETLVETSQKMTRNQFEGFTNNAVSAENLGLKNVPVLGKAVDLLGSAQRLPSWGMEKSDDFFKSTIAHGEKKVLVHNLGERMGLKGKELKDFIIKNMENPPDFIEEMAWKKAKELTFQSDLGGGWELMSKFITEAGKESLGFAPIRFVFPFTKTSMNVTQAGLEYIPALAKLSTNYNKAVMEGGRELAVMKAKQQVGSSMMLFAGYLALNGSITGSGPVNPRQKKFWADMGIKPNHVKIGEKWFPYNTTSVMGRALSMGADVYRTLEVFLDEDGSVNKDLMDYVNLATYAISQRAMPEYFAQTAGNLMDAFNSADISPMVENIVPNMIPLIGAANQFSTMTNSKSLDTSGDPYAEDAALDEMLNKIKAKVPFFNKDIPPRLNIFGEELDQDMPWYDNINPFYGTPDEKINDPVVNELVSLGYNGLLKKPDPPPGQEFLSVSMPQKFLREDNGVVNLNAKQYHRYVRLAAGLDGGDDMAGFEGKTLKEALADLISNNDPEVDYESLMPQERREEIHNIIQMYRDNAKEIMKEEDEEIFNGLMNSQENYDNARGGEE